MTISIDGDGEVQVVDITNQPGPPGPVGPPGPAGPPGPPGPPAAKVGAWNWSSQTTVPPNAGQLRSDSGNWVDATELYVENRTADGVDVGPFLETIIAGDEVRLQQKTDSTRWATYAVAPSGVMVLPAGYATIPVVYQEGGLGAPNNNTELRVAFIESASLRLLEGV